jgi:uncharacterized protein
MKLLIFSDIHSDNRALERLMDMDADYYFAAGDMVTWARGFERIGPILAKRAERMYVLPGNHESEADIDQLCNRFNLHPFHGRTLEIAGHRIAGLGYSSPTPFNTPGEYSEEEIAARLDKFSGLKPLVLICHCPPLNTALDQMRNGQHAGSKAVADFIAREQPEHFFCGHIHEAEGVTIRIGETTATNVGKGGFLLEI